MWYSASAPASLMLMGEYAVVEGFPALVIACKERLFVRVRYREDKKIKLFSEKYGCYETDLHALKISHDWRFVMQAISVWQNKLLSGIDVEIHALFSDQEGLGSSAAVSVAINHVLAKLTLKTLSQRALLRLVRRQIRQVQGMGSGADVAAAIYGGLVFYDPRYLRAQSYLFPWKLFRYFMGYKTPTPQVFSIVKKKFETTPQAYHEIIQAIAQCVLSGFDAIKNKDKKLLIQMINRHQQLLEQLGVCDDHMQHAKNELLKMSMKIDADVKQAKTTAVKISGSGLGDCLLGLGEPEMKMPNVSMVEISTEGVRDEKA